MALDTYQTSGTSPPVPQIRSIGLPPEIHADRVVREMLQYITRVQQENWKTICVTGHFGNPKSQTRAFEKLQKRIGQFMISSDLRTGKRGNFRMRFLTLDTFNPETGECVGSKGKVPSTPWLAYTRVTITGASGYDIKTEAIVNLTVSHHALSRLAQRVGVRTVQDLVMVAHDIGQGFYEKVLANGFPDVLPPGHRMEIDITHPRPMTLVCSVNENQKDGGLVLATLWPKNPQQEL